MAGSIPLQLSLPASFFLEREGAIDRLLTFCDWDHPAADEDIRAAVELLVAHGCGPELIRVGGSGDGAYLLPDLLTGVEACFSPGVSTQTAFETELAERFGIPSYLCDASVEASQLMLVEGMHTFRRRWLGSFDGGNTLILKREGLSRTAGPQALSRPRARAAPTEAVASSAHSPHRGDGGCAAAAAPGCRPCATR